MGLFSSTDENVGDASAHDGVLARFEELGYAVVFKKVCSSSCGVPMTRRRVHYQLLDTTTIADAKQQMLALSRVWGEVLSATYTDRKLDEFLVSETSPYFKKAVQQAKQQEPGARAQGKKSTDDARWKSTHAKLFELHKARPFATFEPSTPVQ